MKNSIIIEILLCILIVWIGKLLTLYGNPDLFCDSPDRYTASLLLVLTIIMIILFILYYAAFRTNIINIIKAIFLNTVVIWVGKFLALYGDTSLFCTSPSRHTTSGPLLITMIMMVAYITLHFCKPKGDDNVP